MTHYQQRISIRWSDIDMNHHLRHSAYYDFAAQLRMQFLESKGLTVNYLKEHHFGPILFREECTFRREIHFNDEILIDLQLIKLAKDSSKFSIQHQFIRAKDQKLCATLIVDGAFMDTELRKLIAPPLEGANLMAEMPKAEAFQWL